MKLLIDTHLLLWAAEDFTRLPAVARKLMAEESNILFFSTVSIWEIVIKNSTRKPDFDVDAQNFYQSLSASGYRELPVTTPQVLAVGTLPPIHKDPFDRLLIAQALVENLTLLTADSKVAQYPAVQLV